MTAARAVAGSAASILPLTLTTERVALWSAMTPAESVWATAAAGTSAVVGADTVLVKRRKGRRQGLRWPRQGGLCG